MIRHRRSFIAGLALWCTLLSARSLPAQSFMMRPQHEKASVVGLRYLHPSFNTIPDLSPLSGTYDFSLSIPMSSRCNLVCEMPLSGFSIQESAVYDGDIEWGNLYLGTRYLATRSNLSGSEIEAGFWLPTANSDTPDLIYLSQYTNYHEMQRHSPEIATFYSNFAYHLRGDSYYSGMFNFEVGPELVFPSTKEYETELFIHYGVSGSFYTNHLAFCLELLGQCFVTENLQEASDHFSHSLVVGSQLMDSNFRPSVFLALPLGSRAEDVVARVLGIKIEFVI